MQSTGFILFDITRVDKGERGAIRGNVLICDRFSYDSELGSFMFAVASHSKAILLGLRVLEHPVAFVMFKAAPTVTDAAIVKTEYDWLLGDQANELHVTVGVGESHLRLLIVIVMVLVSGSYGHRKESDCELSEHCDLCLCLIVCFYY